MKSSIFLLRLLTLVGAQSGPSHYTVHERRESTPSYWNKGQRLDETTSLPVRIGLVQPNLGYGHDLLMKMSDPYSSRYGKHMSQSEVHDLFAPSQQNIDDVRSWLESSNISQGRISQSVNKQWLQFDARVEELERLLHTEYHIYSHTETGRQYVACSEYHIPSSLGGHIDYITPGVALREFGSSTASRIQKRSINGLPPVIEPPHASLQDIINNGTDICDITITPQCIKTMYNISNGTLATKGNELGIFEGIGDVYSQEDLNLFFSTLASEIPQGTHPVLDAIDGAQAPASLFSSGVESDLDFQISYPIIWPQNSILFQTDDMPYENNYTFKGFLNTFLDAIDGSYCSEISNLDPTYPDPQNGGYKGTLQCGVFKLPSVISISYGSAEADLPVSYQRRQCNEFMKLGMQGVSVVVASGDSGVAGRNGDPTPSNCLGDNGQIFVPDFPASCPYMTAAGATYLPSGTHASDHKEVAVSRFPSGGGFSNIYEQPSWQSKAVAAYFARANHTYPYYEGVNNNNIGANGGIYNRIGRGYPDVSAVGDHVLIFNRGAPAQIGGTSASAPVFAAILTRINEERLKVGKPTVGFVNPVLYAHPEAFFDVTTGNNPGCNTSGFKSVEGWDPVTGLGTPNYPALLKIFMTGI
ncbi:hypothetical protein N7495_000012 [Penicillium taxi]|uniref:uncharacterized protein n=1 Tax=Penicillium taxi TaxID=168475 RepID=UPI002544E2FE|nr:uncharacterized protein N7495_000012 [Penicillium taxi]KAJ5907330.1 hypothetical protein N7495_000012 [Penicillium taxi]